ncbi:MAG TPA: hypothetical protein VNQ77_01530 [Frankiaceae bacterium]|nr:hypothetical protein [Frankiaceae bacterium]
MKVRKLGALAAVTAAVLAPIASATPAHAGGVGCTLNSPFVPPAETVNCYTDTVGGCLFYYDPVEVFPNGTVSETVTYAFCTAL